MSSVYRERFAATMAHQPVDRCPIDLGGTPQSTSDSRSLVEGLAEHVGFAGEVPTDYDKFDRRLLEHWDIDFRRCGGLVSFTTDRRQTISEREFIDCYGIRYRYSGLYWDIVGSPLQGSGRDEVDAYELPRREEIPAGVLDEWAGRARVLREETPYVVVGEHPVFGVLELACWLCSYEHLMMMLALDPEYVHLLFKKILAFQKMVIHEYYERLGRYLHVTTSGDDFGTQQGPFMSPSMWREFVKPYLQERIAYTARFTDAVYLHHSCGSIFDIIPDLAEVGVGILNPIQPAAAGMDPQRLKSAYGRAIVFHGGLDTQEVLPSNDPAHIRLAVQRLLQAMHPWADGGYIFAPAHNLQADVSPAAVAAMYEAAHEVSRQESGVVPPWTARGRREVPGPSSSK